MARRKRDFSQQENRPEQIKFQAALYARLSFDSACSRERSTIEAQLSLMRDFAERMPEISVVEEYTDLDYSGTNFERPGFARMMQDARVGKINCIIVKDFSRLGRDYIETGNYMECIFPLMGLRFISINDAFDSFRENMDMIMPFKNLINDFYARDISHKVVSSLQARRLSGKFAGAFAPYGYRRSQKDRGKLEPHPETAAYVVRIFSLFLTGYGYLSIANLFNREQIPSPNAYRNKTGELQIYENTPVKWSRDHVRKLLGNRYYVGDSVYGKQRTAFYRGESSHTVPPEEWIVIENTHEPLISRETFARAQERIAQIAEKYAVCRPVFAGKAKEQNIFSGKLICALCGKHFQMKQYGSSKKMVYFCASYRKSGKEGCLSRYVELSALKQQVFDVIRRRSHAIEKLPMDARQHREGEAEELNREMVQAFVREILVDAAGNCEIHLIYDDLPAEKTGQTTRSEDIGRE